MAVRERGNSYQADLTIKGKDIGGSFVTKDQAIAWEAEVWAAVLAGREPLAPIVPGNSGNIQEARAEKEKSVKGGLTFREAVRKCQNRYWNGEECERKTRQDSLLLYLKKWRNSSVLMHQSILSQRA